MEVVSVPVSRPRNWELDGSDGVRSLALCDWCGEPATRFFLTWADDELPEALALCDECD